MLIIGKPDILKNSNENIDIQAAVIVGLTYNEFTTLEDGTEDYDDGYTINGK